MQDRRARIDGAKGMQEVISQANIPIAVPDCCDLKDDAKPFWVVLAKTKATRAWTGSDLVMLVNLCNTLADVKRWRSQMENEPPVIGEGDKIRAHPLVAMIDQAEKRARLYNSHLQLHPEATQGKSHKQAKQNELHREAMDREEEGDGLLATPH